MGRLFSPHVSRITKIQIIAEGLWYCLPDICHELCSVSVCCLVCKQEQSFDCESIQQISCEEIVKKLFVPYDIALQLKGLGFDDMCFSFYDKRDTTTPIDKVFCHNSCGWLHGDNCAAPLYQQAFDFLKNTLGLHTVIIARSWDAIGKDGVRWSIWLDNLNNHMFHLSIDKDREDNPYTTYREAEDACLIGTLDFYEKYEKRKEESIGK